MPTAETTENEIRRQTFTGVVTSDKMKDTAVVTISRYVKHPKYHKYQMKKTKLLAHDPGNTKKIGDKATVEACRPMSKRKAFKII
ncbi:30S ribosomal protein S17 [Patescibacteria group bacterium]|nr:30S ribosomal protein S17 [Patescibacteria group bacterium]MDE1946869.1 30S ribosomal protein S17 [Patescibacteria group bacterium]MDE2010689.1 30S ribosomal protein S17 [Patescibacteria group bacterium]MDE2232705.1 30S ribosomal protein S17 [Patescibacteria group bacterium]